MILDTLENYPLYTSLHTGLQQFFEAFKQCSPSQYPDGKEHLEEEDAFLIFKEYESKDTKGALMEAHNQYWDIMYMVEGEETVYVKPRKQLKTIVQEYRESGDAMLAELDEDCTPVRLSAGQFLILFPEDAHCPERECTRKQQVKKIIGKLRFAKRDIARFA